LYGEFEAFTPTLQASVNDVAADVRCVEGAPIDDGGQRQRAWHIGRTPRLEPEHAYSVRLMNDTGAETQGRRRVLPDVIPSR
jgi:hypothetical protein